MNDAVAMTTNQFQHIIFDILADDLLAHYRQEMLWNFLLI